MKSIIGDSGRCGVILPTGIATTKTTQPLFEDLVSHGSLVSLFDFDNRRGLFPQVQGNVRFSLVTLRRQGDGEISVAALLQSVDDLSLKGRRYPITPADLERINPNTRGCPMFRSERDAEIVKGIYSRVPILHYDHQPNENAWNVEMRRLLHMGDDSALFVSFESASREGFLLKGNCFTRDAERLLPLYESKLAHQFNHRAATFDGIPESRRFGPHPATKQLRDTDLVNPDKLPLPRYWVASRAAERWVEGHKYLLSFRNAISAVADSRSLVAAALPPYPAGDSLKCVFVEGGTGVATILLAALNSVVVDYVLRQKVSGGNASLFIMAQLPIVEPTITGPCERFPVHGTLAEFCSARVLELSYTSWDISGFSSNVGYDGPPFQWNPKRRFLLRCELDAAMFHLYGVDADDIDYIMDSFPIVKRQDEEMYGVYRTKRVILDIYDEMQRAVETGVPYESRLDPPPADPRVAHPEEEFEYDFERPPMKKVAEEET
jgi:hypothetical protein